MNINWKSPMAILTGVLTFMALGVLARLAWKGLAKGGDKVGFGAQVRDLSGVA